MNNVIISPGILKSTELSNDLVDCLAKECNLVGIFCANDIYKSDWIRTFPNTPVFSRKDLVSPIDKEKKMGYSPDFYLELEGFLHTILGSPELFYLIFRLNKNLKKTRSAFNVLSSLHLIIENSMKIVKSYRPERIIFHTTPHQYISWVFAKVAELMGVEIMYQASSVFLERVHIRRGLKRSVVEYVCEDREKFVIPKGLDLYKVIEKARSSYEVGMPDNQDKIRYKRFKGSFWNIKNEMAFIVRGGLCRVLDSLGASIDKRRSYMFYQSVSEKKILEGSFFTYFLHYQPERTTIPEAAIYAQQVNLIALIAGILGKRNISLVVKEHPTTFRKPWDVEFRDLDFYKSLSQIQNVKIASMDIDSFSLIDASIAVCTITGKVAHEAIYRGKPALVSGPAPATQIPGCFLFESIEELEKLVEVITSVEYRHPTDIEIIDSLRRVYENTFEKCSGKGRYSLEALYIACKKNGV